ncbi:MULTISPECIES: DUF4097 family beta strand repeat-containing protein [unclassified Exiguobacterium]|uniref:DUF4097 family beta strand repeat-containing protein n=1 Tax=unclassified Exiguobacterium TaxID=2644629 RepID=UPI00103B7A8E|nr:MULTISPECIES: DUF4097 family beta strand repeat-containing protein [unclassified Exiguobacterium]TCI44293.1 DUF1700 domain-containing protein [Exiguobacterium sp. SH5S32]TCI50558.1 DUF1700 domain-containing protein [Exiguobacterium sp. SH1S4]TCI69517.1 DUF1700 domain-containing protein [Exiguobacterium sp. SH1S1]
MTEEQYLTELERLLMGISIIDRVDILRDVAEYFASGRLDGKSDEAMAEELGTPNMLASELLVSVDSIAAEPIAPPAIVQSPNVAFQHVSIRVQNAHVNVVPSADGYAYATLEDETEHGVKMDIVNDTLEVRIESERRFGLSDLFSWFGTKTPVLHVELPRHTYESVRLNNRHGSSDVREVRAALIEVESENGRINASEVRAGHGTLRSSNGNVCLTMSAGQDFDVQTSNGRVEVRDSVIERLTLQSSNGRLDIVDVDGAIEAKSSNGRIDCVIDAIEHPLRLKTTNGKIELRLKQEPSDTVIRAKTRNGQLDIFGHRTNERTFGDGALEVKLTSTNGSITVE